MPHSHRDNSPRGSQPDVPRAMSASDHDPVSLRSPSPPRSAADHHKHRSRHQHSHDNHITSSSTFSANHPRLTTRHLLRLLLDAERQSVHLRRILATALTRTDSQTRRADEAERRATAALQQVRDANAAEDAAKSDAQSAREDLARCREQLEDARHEAGRAVEALREAERLRMEAERVAERRREAMKRMEEERLLRAARAEGRRRGFEQGFVRGQQIGIDDVHIQGRRKHLGTRVHRYDQDTLDDDFAVGGDRFDEPPISVIDEHAIPTRYGRELDGVEESARKVTADEDVDHQMEHSPVVRSRFVEQMSEPPDWSDIPPNPPSPDPYKHGPEIQSQPDVGPPPLSGTKTPPIQVYSIPIPPQEELEGPPSPPHSTTHDPTTSAHPVDSGEAPNGPRRRTRSGRFVHYLTSTRPRRWPSVKSNETTVSAASANQVTRQDEPSTDMGLINKDPDILTTEDGEAQFELHDHPAPLKPSSSEVREMFEGIIKPLRSLSLRRRKTNSEQTGSVEFDHSHADPGESVHWQYVDTRETHHKHPVLAFTRRALRRVNRAESPVPEITIISPSASFSSERLSVDHPSPEHMQQQVPLPPDHHTHVYSPPTPDSPVINTPPQEAWVPSGFVPGIGLVKSVPRDGLVPAIGRPLHGKEHAPWWSLASSGSEEGMG